MKTGALSYRRKCGYTIMTLHHHDCVRVYEPGTRNVLIGLQGGCVFFGTDPPIVRCRLPHYNETRDGVPGNCCGLGCTSGAPPEHGTRNLDVLRWLA
jgi:hypothetical protein